MHRSSFGTGERRSRNKKDGIKQTSYRPEAELLSLSTNYCMLYLRKRKRKDTYLDLFTEKIQKQGPTTQGIPSAQLMVSKRYIHLKEPEFFGTMADDRSGTENVQDKSGISCHSKKTRKMAMNSRVMLKGLRSHLK